MIVGLMYPVLLVAGTVVPYVWWRDGLPSPIAIHFDVSGKANGSAPVVVHLAVSAGFTFAAAGLLAWPAWRRSSRLGTPMAVVAFVGWLVASLNILVLGANRGHDQWHDATLGPGAIWGATFGALGAAILVALIVRHGADADSASAAPQLALATTERAAWFGHANSRVIATSVVVLLSMGTIVLLATSSGAALGLVLFATGLAMAAFMTVDVAVGEDGLRVQTGLPWPQLAIPLTDIQAARVVDWQPLRGPVVTGWGYRGSLRLMGRAGWVVRGGPALQLDLTRGRQFIVTADDADEAASVLNGLIARPGVGGSTR